MVEFDPTRLLSLLERFVSEETKKTRRNSLFISFVITSIFFLDLSISDLKVFGLSLDKGDQIKLLFLALVLLLFWYFLYLISYSRDKAIDAERKYNLNQEINVNSERIAALEKEKKQYEKNTNQKFHNNEHKTRGEFMETYEAYLGRTNRANKLNLLMGYVEHWVPNILVVFSTLILGSGIYVQIYP